MAGSFLKRSFQLKAGRLSGASYKIHDLVFLPPSYYSYFATYQISTFSSDCLSTPHNMAAVLTPSLPGTLGGYHTSYMGPSSCGMTRPSTRRRDDFLPAPSDKQSGSVDTKPNTQGSLRVPVTTKKPSEMSANGTSREELKSIIEAILPTFVQLFMMKQQKTQNSGGGEPDMSSVYISQELADARFKRGTKNFNLPKTNATIQTSNFGAQIQTQDQCAVQEFDDTGLTGFVTLDGHSHDDASQYAAKYWLPRLNEHIRRSMEADGVTKADKDYIERLKSYYADT